MHLVDANVLLYAVNQDSPHHAPSRRWMEHSLSGGAVVGFAWQSLLTFIRLATTPGILTTPMSALQAVGWVSEWLQQEPARQVFPRQDHIAVLGQLLIDVDAGGGLVNEGHLAALAIEHRAIVVSFDHDFARFPGVRWERPE